MQETQQDSRCLLLQVRNCQTEWQVIHGTVQCLGKFCGHYNCRIRVVALSHIQHARQSIGKSRTLQLFTMNQAILSTTHCENERVIRSLFCQVGKITAFPLRTIASTNEKYTRQVSRLGSFNDLIGKRDDDTMIKSNRHVLSRIHRLFESLFLLCLCNHLREITTRADMLDTIIAHFIHCPDSIFVNSTRFNNTIGRHDDWPWKCCKFKFLILPRRSIVSNKVFEFL
mmetsp:Transcript_3853/g.7110  ORF Transcript_3853/g.7110 Transcript_3853/m.7110 type:complete len:227 (-) Transcript_3853:1029-1709(-)